MIQENKFVKENLLAFLAFVLYTFPRLFWFYRNFQKTTRKHVLIKVLVFFFESIFVDDENGHIFICLVVGRANRLFDYFKTNFGISLV